MPLKTGPILRGHPHINIQVSADGKTGQVHAAMIDTGFSGFVSVPAATAQILGLEAHTYARYTLANGKSTEAVPLAEGFASLEEEHYVNGLISISENSPVVVGMSFLKRAGKALILISGGVILMDEKELMTALKAAGSE